MLAARSALYLAVISILCTDVSARRSVTIPEDNPQACRWDVKMCVDGTWVYRSAEINCEFEECQVTEAGPGTAI
ncbi:hypothetical protein V7S43_002683 [Phytophthora oleae]|uniref:Uncharacterized protein n=1 Tax=Phytophthora oleae TaxID=2107226 RepID=A0ABD3FYM4_9STRA